MPIFDPSSRKLADAVSAAAHCNPFAPERIERERAALADAFDPRDADWNLHHHPADDHPNVKNLLALAAVALDAARAKLEAGKPMADDEREPYEDLALFVVYHRWRSRLDELISEALAGRPRKNRLSMYAKFEQELGGYLNAGSAGGSGGVERRSPAELAHAFAVFFQIRRAFGNIYNFIIGASKPAARLRAAVWQSIFTHDLRRYRRALFDRMADYTTLITGESGTGKELVARAVGLSRYIPFDPETQSFGADFFASFVPVNLSALSETLIESELFGHQRGSFTGAVGDRVGWLESCDALGTVFLDEIGELAPVIQVKLLRVLQSRRFSRLGDTAERTFAGKIIAATNRDVAERMRAGSFREDFYYRLCGDTIATPTLRDRLADHPAELPALIAHIARRIVGDEEAPAVADEVERWIAAHLGDAYPWPGNVRELEQCVRNVLIRGEYRPAPGTPGTPGSGDTDARRTVAAAMCDAALSADELLTAYCTIAYAKLGSYEAAARQLALDRRTIKSRIDQALLARLK